MTKEELYQKYIVENMLRKDCAAFFNVTERTLVRRLEQYNIKKDPKKTYENRKKAMLERYGEEYAVNVPLFKEKMKNTMLERYGVEYTAESSELRSKMQKTMLKKYHKKNFVETKLFQEKSQKTCLEKFGVKYPCQYPNCIKSLENASGHSKPEKEFANHLSSFNIEYEQEFPIRGFKYDFKIGNTLVEIDPTSTHNDKFGLFGKKPKNKIYHYTKYSVAKEFNYKCIHVFDWDSPSKVINTFFVPKEKIYARKCELRAVNKQEAREFLEKYHLQGYANDKIRLGLYFGAELVEIMTFDKPRYNKNYEYELVRLCSNRNVVGGAEKILNHFIKMYNPKNIISYCDISKFSGKIYDKLGFKLLKRNAPSKHWYNIITGEHITDNLLRQRGFDQLFKTNFGKGTSNELLMLEIGFLPVYDCGQLTYELKLRSED